MSSYAFIRFASLAEASKMARLTNGILIYGWSIISKVATSDWNNRRMGLSKGSRKEEGCEVKFQDFISNSKLDTSRQDYKRDIYQNFRGHTCVLAQRCKNTRDPHQNFKGDRNDKGWSYTEAIKGDDVVKNSRKKKMMVKMEEMYWEGSKVDDGWPEKCVVGVLRGFDEISSVNYRLTNRGFSLSSSYLGDKLILWEFDSEEDCNGFINNRFFFGTIDLTVWRNGHSRSR
ncbi:hypothetical protein Q3G72_020386 [Acer saccharum]|nr:hypothetical protein Q3G72_004279 [Acer saccharum]KAK1588163.1 hypothetical protein Q3G72_020386 [Acer saccharum]